VEKSECQGDPYGGEGDGTVEGWAQGNTIHIKHSQTLFNCCSTVKAFLEKGENNLFNITYQELEPVCNCMCLFDLEMEIPGLAPGTYFLLIWKYDKALAPVAVEVK